MENTKIFLAATAIKLLSVLGLLFMPYQVGVLVESLGFSKTDAGFIATLETTGIAIGVVLVTFRLLPFAVRHFAIIGVVLAIAGNLASLLMTDVDIAASIRFITGLGYGLANATATKLIATSFKNTEKMAGRIYATIYVIAAILYYVIPLLIDQGGKYAFYLSLSLLVLFLAPTIVWVPVQGPDSAQAKKSLASVFLRKPVLILFATEIILMTGLGAVWSFSERFADSANLSPEKIGLYFALSSIGQFFGAMFASYTATKWGRTLPFIGCIIPAAIISYYLSHSATELAFAIGILGFQFLVAYILPYILGTGAALDKGGSVAAAAIGVQIFSFGGGALVGGVVADLYSLQSIGWLAVISCIIALVFLPIVTRPLDKLSRQHDAAAVADS